MEVLHGRLDGAFDGRESLATLVGEAGFGKARLANEIGRNACRSWLGRAVGFLPQT